MKTATLLLLSLLFALPAQAAERQPYTCDNGSRLDISFAEDAEGRPQATLHFADEAMILPQVPAASGALYRKGDIRLHTRGDEAFFEDGKNNQRRCTRGNLPPAVAAVAQPATSSFIEIGGTVSYLARIALPPDAILIIRVLDTARAGAPARVLAGTASITWLSPP
jgi:putative lipoprotein